MKKYVVFPIVLVTVILSLWGCMLFPPGPHIKIEVAPTEVSTSIGIILHETAGIECRIRTIIFKYLSFSGAKSEFYSPNVVSTFGTSILPPRGYLIKSDIPLTNMPSDTGELSITINATDAYNQIFEFVPPLR